MPDTTTQIPMNWHIVTSAKYKAGTPLAGDLYYLSDTKQVFRGTEEYSPAVIIVAAYENLPAVADAIQSRLYFVKGTGKLYVSDGTAWHVASDDTNIPYVSAVTYDQAEHTIDVDINGQENPVSFALNGLAVNLQLVTAEGQPDKIQLVDAAGELIGNAITLPDPGADIEADNASIVLDNGKIALAAFGKEYYRCVSADTILPEGEYTFPDTMPTGEEGAYVKVNQAWYKYSEGAWAVSESAPKTTTTYEKVTGWKAGLEPKVVAGEGSSFTLAWYEPSSTTVEGLSAAIGALSASVENMQASVAAASTAATEAKNLATSSAAAAEAANTAAIAAGQSAAVAAETATAAANKADTNASAIETLNGDVDTEGSVAATVKGALDDRLVWITHM